MSHRGYIEFNEALTHTHIETFVFRVRIYKRDPVHSCTRERGRRSFCSSTRHESLAAAAVGQTVADAGGCRRKRGRQMSCTFYIDPFAQIGSSFSRREKALFLSLSWLSAALYIVCCSEARWPIELAKTHSPLLLTAETYQLCDESSGKDAA